MSSLFSPPANQLAKFELAPSLRPSRFHHLQQITTASTTTTRTRIRTTSESDWFQSDVEDELVRLEGNTETLEASERMTDINLLHLVEAN